MRPPGGAQRTSASMPDDRPRRQIHDGLVVQAQLAVGRAPAQGLLRVEAADGSGSHGLGEDAVRARPQLLGPVHGRVGVSQQVGGRRVVGRGHCDPDTDGDEVVRAVKGTAWLTGFDRGRRGDRLGLAQHVLAQDDELVAAEAGTVSSGRTAEARRSAIVTRSGRPKCGPGCR